MNNSEDGDRGCGDATTSPRNTKNCQQTPNRVLKESMLLNSLISDFKLSQRELSL
jgi:hypothetical protein